MKFRVAEPCPHCGCRCEEYNPDTEYIGCPQCERSRNRTLSYEGKYRDLIHMIYDEDCDWGDYAEYIVDHGDFPYGPPE